jgi:hypothetical protein
MVATEPVTATKTRYFFNYCLSPSLRILVIIQYISNGAQTLVLPLLLGLIHLLILLLTLLLILPIFPILLFTRDIREYIE